MPSKETESPAEEDSSPIRSYVPLAKDSPVMSVALAKRLRSIASDLRDCPSGDANEFRAAIMQVTALGGLGLHQRTLARRLFVTPMTLTRWTLGRNIPPVLSREGYLLELACIADELAGVVESACTVQSSAEREVPGAPNRERASRLTLVAG